MNYLAIDLGSTNSKSVGVLFDPEQNPGGQIIRFQTDRHSISQVIEQRSVQLVIIEMCSATRWVWKHLRHHGVTVLVADTNAQSFRDAGQRHKTDRHDAIRLKDLYLLGNLKCVHMLSDQAHRLRSLIDQRQRHVSAQTAIKNAIRAHCELKGVKLYKYWTRETIGQIESLIDDAQSSADEDPEWGWIWHKQLDMALRTLLHHMEIVKEFDTLIQQVSKRDKRIALVQSAPGVGKLIGSAVVAAIDDPGRFRHKKQVSAYSGLTPRSRQSGAHDRPGNIDRRGWSTLRGLLTEAVLHGVHHAKDPWMVNQYEHLLTRCGKKIKAVVALARKLFVRLWHMLKHQKTWQDISI